RIDIDTENDAVAARAAILRRAVKTAIRAQHERGLGIGAVITIERNQGEGRVAGRHSEDRAVAPNPAINGRPIEIAVRGKKEFGSGVAAISSAGKRIKNRHRARWRHPKDRARAEVAAFI